MPRLAANLSLLFSEVPFLERFEQAARAGFRAVECQFPYAWAPEAIAVQLQGHGLQQVLFNLPAGDWDAGERGIACLPGREADFREGVERALRYAEIMKCRQINCLAGLLPTGVPPEPYWATFEANLRWAAPRLAEQGITLLIEAINSKVDVPGFLLDHSKLALDLIDRLNLPNLKLQYDLYHMQIMEGDLLRTLGANLPQIGHIQFADNPGRHEPGTGEINFRRIFEQLDAWGYEGWVAAEYVPEVGTFDGLSCLKSWL